MVSQPWSDSLHFTSASKGANKGEVVLVEGDNLCSMITSEGLVLEMEYDCYDEELYNFEIAAALEKDKAPFDFDPYLNVNAILKMWGYFPGMVIERKAQRWTTLPLM